MAGLIPFLAIGSTALSAVSSIRAGQAQKAVYDYQAQVDDINAGSALSQGAAEQQRLQIQSQRRVATGVNAAAGSGIDPNSGSPLDVVTDVSRQGALDGEIARWRGLSAATADENQADQATFAGTQAAAAGEVGAVNTVLGNAASYGLNRYSARAGAYANQGGL